MKTFTDRLACTTKEAEQCPDNHTFIVKKCILTDMVNILTMCEQLPPEQLENIKLSLNSIYHKVLSVYPFNEYMDMSIPFIPPIGGIKPNNHHEGENDL